MSATIRVLVISALPPVDNLLLPFVHLLRKMLVGTLRAVSGLLIMLPLK